MDVHSLSSHMPASTQPPLPTLPNSLMTGHRKDTSVPDSEKLMGSGDQHPKEAGLEGVDRDGQSSISINTTVYSFS